MREGILNLRKELLEEGVVVHTQDWQGKPSPMPFLEILHVRAVMQMEDSPEEAARQCNPWLPWADMHFDERVSGVPLNPPPSHTVWLKGNEEYKSGEKFSHSYPERFWPKSLMPQGIRYKTGDLDNLVELLRKDPTTRQAYLPIYFPEDIYASSVLGERVPCTLGYHFIVRGNQMDVFYPMRSCDAVRHLHNDIYLANRLAIHVAKKADLRVSMGILHFVATSLHCFENDRYALKKLVGGNL